MRYIITRDDRSSDIHDLETSTLARAEELFNEVTKHAERGVQVKLTDTKTDKVLRVFRRSTPDEVRAMKEREIERLCDRADNFRDEVREFIDRLSKALDTGDPGYPFRWADGGFDAVAKYQTHLALRELHREQKCSIAQMREYFHNRVMREARSPSRSTGACQNLHAQYQLSADAYMVETLQNILAWEAE